MSSSPSRSTQTVAQLVQRVSGPPINFSFRDIKVVNDVLFEEPVSGQSRHPPIPRDTSVPEYLESISGEAVNPHEGVRYNATAVRLCNNHLMSLAGLDKALHHVLDDPREMVWLDASCNQIHSIEDVILKFPRLQVLYLHGNQISHLGDVLKLSKLEHLVKLTLHGNPIAELKNYKLWVAAHLPKLRSLDFSTITKVDRDKVATWYRAYQKREAS